VTITRERLAELDRHILWTPQPGPQLDAWNSPADLLGFGGSAGGGKSALLLGLAVSPLHRRSLIIRRELAQCAPLVDELGTILGSRDGWNGSEHIWKLPGGRQVRFGGCASLGDEARYQGAPRDFLGIDEATNLLESQARFLMAWVRSTTPGQRCRTVLASNPPTSSEGEWFIRWFAPWIDPHFPVRAAPGELRWVAMLDGKEEWVEGPAPITHKGESIQPTSRTFIPSRITQNAYLRNTGYLAQLQALPEPLRSQMLMGDFTAGATDDEWATIPAPWVKAAMDRWTPVPEGSEITSVGVDPSRGGADETIIARRSGWHFHELLSLPPSVSATGGGVTKRVLDVAGEHAPVHVDVIGIGSSVVDHLEAYIGRRCVAVNNAAASLDKDATGNFRFANIRAASYWRLRELLDPARAVKVALPRDHRLLADLTAARYRLTARGIQIESKQDIQSRLGRSPDRGDAVVLAAMRTPILYPTRR
jgi:hypothetical protein